MTIVLTVDVLPLAAIALLSRLKLSPGNSGMAILFGGNEFSATGY
jgi:hypothetical protein